MLLGLQVIPESTISASIYPSFNVLHNNSVIYDEQLLLTLGGSGGGDELHENVLILNSFRSPMIQIIIHNEKTVGK